MLSLKNKKPQKIVKKFQPSTTKLIPTLSSTKAIISQVVDFILHAIYNKPKREKSFRECRYPMLFVEKGKKKKIVETKLLQLDEQLLHIKILRVLFHLAEQIV